MANLSLQKPSITGLASYGSQSDSHHLVSCESTNEALSFFDMRMLVDQMDVRNTLQSYPLKNSLIF